MIKKYEIYHFETLRVKSPHFETIVRGEFVLPFDHFNQ